MRAIREGKADPQCQAEPAFSELFAVLGDFQEQERIRQTTPGPHCGLLVNSASSCSSCQLNPLIKSEDAEAFHASREHAEALGEAQYFWDLWQVGFRKGIDQILPEEFETLRLMRQHEAMIGARIQGVEVARIIAGLFGTKEKG